MGNPRCVKNGLHFASSAQKCIHFTLGCYWVKLIPQRLHNPPQLSSRRWFDVYSWTLGGNLKTWLCVCLRSQRCQGKDRWAEGFFSAWARLQGSRRWFEHCHALVDVSQADSSRPLIKSKRVQDGRLWEQSPVLGQPCSCSTCLMCNLWLILMEFLLFWSNYKTNHNILHENCCLYQPIYDHNPYSD